MESVEFEVVVIFGGDGVFLDGVVETAAVLEELKAGEGVCLEEDQQRNEDGKIFDQHALMI